MVAVLFIYLFLHKWESTELMSKEHANFFKTVTFCAVKWIIILWCWPRPFPPPSKTCTSNLQSVPLFVPLFQLLERCSICHCHSSHTDQSKLRKGRDIHYRVADNPVIYDLKMKQYNQMVKARKDVAMSVNNHCMQTQCYAGLVILTRKKHGSVRGHVLPSKSSKRALENWSWAY